MPEELGATLTTTTNPNLTLRFILLFFLSAAGFTQAVAPTPPQQAEPVARYPGDAQTPTPPPADSGGELKAVLSQMDGASEHFRNAQADVELVQYTAVLKGTGDEKDVQSGKIFFRRKGHGTEIALWIEKPHPKQAVVKDDKLTFLDVRTRQVTQRNLGSNKADVEAVMNLGFGGRGRDLLAEYNATFGGWETVDGTRTARLELVAKSEKLRQLFTKVVVWIDPQRDVALQQQRFESSGDYQLTHYTNIKLNTSIPDEKFTIEK